MADVTLPQLGETVTEGPVVGAPKGRSGMACRTDLGDTLPDGRAPDTSRREARR
jgi:hypothetical protein